MPFCCEHLGYTRKNITIQNPIKKSLNLFIIQRTFLFRNDSENIKIQGKYREYRDRHKIR